MENQKNPAIAPNPRNPRLTVRGAEIVDPTPKVAFMKIDPKTGEVVQEGRPRPRSIEELLARSVYRNDMGYDVEHGDDDFDVDEDDGSLPVFSPLQEGFMDANAPSLDQAIKTLKKAGKLPPDFDYNPAPSPDAPKVKKGARPQKAGAPDPSEPASGEEE